MAVAKSYQGLPQLSKPYEHNGKMYITIETKSGHCKDVRWYSDKEYAKMYPEDKIDKTKDLYYKPQKLVLGFDKGYITIFKGVKEEHEAWFKKSICRFAVWWGWYVPSSMIVPEDLPSGVQPVRLYWDGMGNEQDKLKDLTIVKAHVKAALKAVSAGRQTSKAQGNIGERLGIRITVIERKEIFGKWGAVFEYIMTDRRGNYYKWKTAAKDWQVGSEHNIRGSVKDYDEYNDEDCTVLTRCLEDK